MKIRASIVAKPASLATLLLFLANCSESNPSTNTGTGGAPVGGAFSGGAGAAGSSSGGATSGGATSGGSLSTAGGGTAPGGSSGAGTAGGGAGGQSTAGGGNAGASAAGSGGGEAIPATFATLKAVIQKSCFGGVCHSEPGNPLQLVVDSKLYTTLTTKMTRDCGPVLKAGSPQDSAIVKLLKGPCGKTQRMPLDKCFEDTDEACVPPDYIAAIERWIANGAPQ